MCEETRRNDICEKARTLIILTEERIVRIQSIMYPNDTKPHRQGLLGGLMSDLEDLVLNTWRYRQSKKPWTPPKTSVNTCKTMGGTERFIEECAVGVLPGDKTFTRVFAKSSIFILKDAAELGDAEDPA